MGQIKYSNLYIVTEYKAVDKIICKMLRLAHRSSVLGTSARLLASSSVVKQQERNGSASSKKAVVFNLGGAMVPAMSPVLAKHAQQQGLTEAELTSKLFVEGDQDLLHKLNLHSYRDMEVGLQLYMMLLVLL